MQISSFTDYSIRVLMHLATLPPGELTRIRYVSELYDISRNHLVKIVHRLGQLGYIETVQGKNGGFRLNAAAENIFLGELFQNLESMQLIDCSPSFCHISKVCRLRTYFADSRAAFLKELNKYSIQDLILENPELGNALKKQN